MYFKILFYSGSNLMNSNQSENSYEEKKTDMKKKRRKRKNKAQVNLHNPFQQLKKRYRSKSLKKNSIEIPTGQMKTSIESLNV